MAYLVPSEADMLGLEELGADQVPESVILLVEGENGSGGDA